MSSTSERKAAGQAVLAEHERLLDERRDIDEDRVRLEKRARANEAALFDCVAAGRLFGLQIEPPTDSGLRWVRIRTRAPGEGPPSSASPKSEPPKEPVQGSLLDNRGELTIREIVLDQLKMAGPRGTKAAHIRRVVENILGRQIHYKTIGMTLFRLSQKDLAKREGLMWFFVPPNADTKNPGGDTPGL